MPHTHRRPEPRSPTHTADDRATNPPPQGAALTNPPLLRACVPLGRHGWTVGPRSGEAERWEAPRSARLRPYSAPAPTPSTRQPQQQRRAPDEPLSTNTEHPTTAQQQPAPRSVRLFRASLLRAASNSSAG
ncbi:hypothetical protein GCM10027072_14680 [Streptomyces bullii]